MFFILTTGRSGSASIAKYLSSVPEFICLHEPVPILVEEATQYIYGEYPHHKLVELLRSTRPSEIMGREYGESNQKLSFIISPLCDAFPDCKFIWLVRDGRDVVNSIFSLGWYDLNLLQDSKWQSGLVQAPGVGELDDDQWSIMLPFEKCCWYWSFTNRHIKRELFLVDRNKWIVIRLENIEYDNLFNFLGVKIVKKKIPWVNKKRKIEKNQGCQSWNEEQKKSFKTICGTQMNEFYPGWISRKGEWVETFKLSRIAKVRNFLQDKLVNVKGKESFIYKVVSIPIQIIFRGHSSRILNNLDKIFKKISGEY